MVFRHWACSSCGRLSSTCNAFRGDWEDRQKILELERAEEAQRQAEKGDPRIALLEDMVEKLDEKDPQRDTLKREIRNRKAAIARWSGTRRTPPLAADGDQMGAANAFMKVGVKVVKKKKKIDDDLDMEEEAADEAKSKGKAGVKKGRGEHKNEASR